MKYFISTNNEGTDIIVDFTARLRCHVVTTVYDLDSDVVFNVRNDSVVGSLKVILKVPFSPRNLVVNIDTNIPNNLVAHVTNVPVQRYNIQLGSKQMEFMKFIQSFALKSSSGELKPSDTILKSGSGNYKLVYLPMIYTYEGRHKETPCQIGKDSGIIEVDQFLFDQYTLSGQIALLCHEYAHFYENPIHGLNPADEEGADKFGLLLFIGAGYGPLEYLNAFKKTFKRVDTDQNRRREKLILNYADQICKGHIFGKPH